MRWLVAVSVAVFALLGCTSAPKRTVASVVPQTQIPVSWSFEGRLAVSNGKDGGSGHIRWEQDGEFFTISLRAPISGQSWQLSGDGSHARLEGVKPYPVLGTSARELLRRELGWELPVGEMRTWLFGRGFGAQAELRLAADDTLAEVNDSGWNITYRNWKEINSSLVPGRIAARKSPNQVRLAIQSWKLEASGVDGGEQ